MQHPQMRNSSPKKHGRKPVLILIGLVLVLSLALVLLLPVIKAWFPAQPSGPTREYTEELLDEADKALLSEITVKHKGQDSYTFTYENGELFLHTDGNKQVLVGEYYSDIILTAATYISVADVVTRDGAEVKEHLPDMGLEPPESVIQIRYTDGREDKFEIGSKVPETTFYYFRWSGAPGVYMCDYGTYEAFAYTPAILIPVSQPVLEKTLIDRITLDLAGQEPMEIVFPADGSTVMKSPFLYPLDATAADGLLTAASGFRLGTLQGELTPENRTEYGFDDPIATIDIHQQAGAYGQINEEGVFVTQAADEQTLRVVLGRKEGDYFYTCAYGDSCYLVSSFLVAPLTAASPASLLTRTPADMGNTIITGIQVQLGDQMLDIRQQRTERVLPNNQLDTDELGNILYDTSYTRNGDPLSEEAFNTLVNKLKAMKVSGEAPEGTSITGSAPRWQLTLTTQAGAVRTLAAYPLDTFFDILAVDGVPLHTLQVESLDIALGDLME